MWSTLQILICGNFVPRMATLEGGMKHKGLGGGGGRSSVQGKGVRSTDLAGVKGVLAAAGLVLPGRLLQRSKVPILLPPGSSALHQSPDFLSHHVISSSLLQPSRYRPSRCDMISCCLQFSTSRAVDSISFPASGVFLQ